MKNHLKTLRNPTGEKSGLWDHVIFRIFPAFALIVSLVSIILPSWFIPLGNYTIHYPVLFSILHVVSSIIFILILVFPYKYFFYTILGFIFSIYLPLEQADILYSFFYVVMLLASLYYIDFFKTRRHTKMILISAFYIILFTGMFLFHGKEYIRENLFTYLVTLSLIVISVTFVFSVQRIKVDSGNETPCLDLDESKSFTDREIIIICKILQNEKYDYIARILNLSEITVKKAAANIYKKLDCTDKVDLFGKYANHIVVKGETIFLTEDRFETEAFEKLLKKERSASVTSGHKPAASNIS